MASGNFSSNTGTQLNLYVTWSSTTNIAGNYSTVTMKVYLKHYSLYAISRINSTMSCNGTKYTYTSPAINYSGSAYTSTLLGSHSFTVAHNADGKKTGVPISATWQFDGTYGSTSIGTISASTTINLDAIARASSISLSSSSVNVGSTQTINIARASSSFTHTLTYAIGSTTGTIATKTASTSVNWTIPESFYSLMPSSSFGYTTITCTTYNGNTAIGTSTKSFTVNVPSTIKPSIGSITASIAGNSIAANWGVYVQGKSTTKIAVSGCSAGTGSKIKSYTFSGNSLSRTISSVETSANATSGYLTSTGTLSYTVTVTDTRGRSASKTVTITSYPYSAPQFNSISAFRCDASGNQSDSGQYIKFTYDANYSSCNGKNTISYAPKYKKSTDATWTSLSLNASTHISTTTFDPSVSYQVQCVATDALSGTSTSNTIVIGTQSRLFNVKADGTGIAFGKMAEVSNTFDCEYDAIFRNDVTLNGKVQASYMPTLLCGLANKITSSSNLNTTEYLIPGNYSCSASDTAKTLTNSPTNVGFRMTVYNCLGEQTNPVSVAYVYLVREIVNLYGDTWVQYVSSGSTAGAFTYGSWNKVLTSYNIKNYVVEETSSGIWTYRKWSNGDVECWGKTEKISSLPLTTVTDSGNCYYNPDLSNKFVDLPDGLFTSINNVQLTAHSNGYIIVSLGSYSTDSIQYRLFAPYNSTHSDAHVMINVYGKYK